MVCPGRPPHSGNERGCLDLNPEARHLVHSDRATTVGIEAVGRTSPFPAHPIGLADRDFLDYCLGRLLGRL